MACRILTLFLVCILAGCSQAPPSQSSTDDPSDERVEVAPGVDVAANRAAVLGSVLSDAGLAIQGARISILGTPHFSDTDSRGAFLLRDVVPGPHRIQAQAEGFRVQERAIELEAGTALHVNLTLQPNEGLLPTERPHVHDLWRGRTEVTLVDLEYDLAKQPGFRGGSSPVYPVYWPSMVLDPNTNTDGLPIPVPTQEDGSASIVFPGTGRIEVTFAWTVNEGTTKDRLALAYRGPNVDRTVTEPGGPGTTWTIDVNQTQVDGGHELWTAWRFYIVYVDRITSPTSWDPGVSLGTVHVLITIHRGEDPPLEPAHEDHWGSNTTLRLRSADDVFSYGGYPTSHRETFEQRPDVVPPETVRLWVKLTWRFENAVVPLLGDEYSLMWRTAAQNPFTTTWEQYHRGQAIETGAGYKVYEIDVLPSEWDQYYATSSDWSFSPYRPGYEDDSSDYGAQNRDRVFSLEIIAHRT